MRATRLVASKVRATCCQPPLVMAAAGTPMTWGVRFVSQMLAQREPGMLLLPGRPPSQNWTPCGKELVASFHSTSGEEAGVFTTLAETEKAPVLSLKLSSL